MIFEHPGDEARGAFNGIRDGVGYVQTHYGLVAVPLHPSDSARMKMEKLPLGQRVIVRYRGIRHDASLRHFKSFEVFTNAAEEATAHPEPKRGLTEDQQRALENLFL